MEGTVIAVMGTDWYMIEFEDKATGAMWRMKIQGEEGGDVLFAPGEKVVLTKKGASE